MILFFVLWRLIIFAPLVIGAYLIPANVSFPVSYIYNYLNSDLSFASILLYPWANFDGIHYLNIASNDYTNQARFFPLFPLVLWVISGSLVVNIVLVSVIFFLALYIFKKLIILDFSNQITTKSLIYLLLFPTSFFFVSIYSEGLFLLLTLLSFYFARKKRWFLSIICASLLTATRFVGIAILPALLFEFVINEKIQSKKLLLFIIAPLGLVLYSLFNLHKWNNLLYFVQSQGELGNNRSVDHLVFFPQTTYRYLKILTTVPRFQYDWAVALLEFATFIFIGILLVIAWKKKIRTSYLIYAAINFFIIISTGTFSALPRYVLTIFPIFITLVLIKSKLIKLLYLFFSPILLFILLMLFSRGYFVA